MPGWQRWYQQHAADDFAFVSVALEHLGAEAARPYVEAAAPDFPTVVDEHGLTADRFGYKAVPNGVLVDADGMVRYAKYGGFSIDNADDVAAVERFLAGEELEATPATDDPPYTLGPRERDEVTTKLRLGRSLSEQGRRDEAVSAWRDALHLDPENLVIRKQIWIAEHPEKFAPIIDWDWQRVQLQRERDDEIARGICGPDGCPIPWSAGTPTA